MTATSMSKTIQKYVHPKAYFPAWVHGSTVSASTRPGGLVGVSGIFIRFANSVKVADPALGNDISSDAIAMISIDFAFGFPFERVLRWNLEILRLNCCLSDQMSAFRRGSYSWIPHGRYIIICSHVIEYSNSFCHRSSLCTFVSPIYAKVCSQISRPTLRGMPDSSIKMDKI